MTVYGLLSSAETREIRDKVLHPNKETPQSPGKRSYYIDEFYAVLNADLAAATNPLTGTTADVRRLKYSDITTDTTMVVDSETISTRNRSESMTGARGTLCLVKYLGAEYIFVWVDCEVSSTLLAAL